ncbi:MAG: hypothetical protein ACJZ70_07770 [Limisphaerales bacterium]
MERFAQSGARGQIEKFGQAEIENPDGAPFLFNVKPTREGEVLKRGESAVIVDIERQSF